MCASMAPDMCPSGAIQLNAPHPPVFSFLCLQGKKNGAKKLLQARRFATFSAGLRHAFRLCVSLESLGKALLVWTRSLVILWCVCFHNRQSRGRRSGSRRRSVMKRCVQLSLFPEDKFIVPTLPAGAWGPSAQAQAALNAGHPRLVAALIGGNAPALRKVRRPSSESSPTRWLPLGCHGPRRPPLRPPRLPNPHTAGGAPLPVPNLEPPQPPLEAEGLRPPLGQDLTLRARLVQHAPERGGRR